MRKKLLCGMVMGVFLLCLAGAASATLTTIGTATYDGSDYKLIWDDDNNGKSVVWLDYTNGPLFWLDQKAWANSLDAVLTINLYSGYTVIWEDPSWRLPSTVDGPYVHGYDGSTTGGYNITNSEMGHLYYEELGNLGKYRTDGSNRGSTGWGPVNTGNFEHLIGSGYTWYWSGTRMEYFYYDVFAWVFSIGVGGFQSYARGSEGFNAEYGLALRSGQVSTVGTVPIPAPLLLLGTGLLCLTPMVYRKRGRRC